WVDRGGAISGNNQVTEYPDPISQKSAEALARAEVFRFDASDLMPEAMNAAFWQAVLDYTQNPGQLDSILANLDQVQADAYGGWTNRGRWLWPPLPGHSEVAVTERM